MSHSAVDTCILLSTFNMKSFAVACSELAVIWYVWQPPGEAPRADRVLPDHQRAVDRKRLAALYLWAERTDPGAVIRGQFAKQIWEERPIGASLVYNPFERAPRTVRSTVRNGESLNGLVICS
jgi:hypothetical protein